MPCPCKPTGRIPSLRTIRPYAATFALWLLTPTLIYGAFLCHGSPLVQSLLLALLPLVLWKWIQLRVALHDTPQCPSFNWEECSANYWNEIERSRIPTPNPSHDTESSSGEMESTR
jgi:hypothetical protein